MSHGEPWEFFQLGKYLERACQTARILDVKYHILLPTPEQVGTPVDQAHWIAILTSCSGYEPFHKKLRPHGDIATAVADFLMFDPQFPRSVICCLAECEEALRLIAGRPAGEGDNEAGRLLGELTGWLRRSSIADVIRAGLHESLTRVVDSTHDVGNAIHQTYFDVKVQLP